MSSLACGAVIVPRPPAAAALALALALAGALAGCSGEPEARATLPPLPSEPAPPSADPTPLPTGTPSDGNAPDSSATPTPGASSADPGTPTPTATPTADVPADFSPRQLEVAAFVEEYWASYRKAIEVGDISGISSLMTADCPCQVALEPTAEAISRGARQDGGDIKVSNMREVFINPDGQAGQALFDANQEAGQLSFDDGSSSTIPAQSGATIMTFSRAGDRWLVSGVEGLD